MLKRIRAMAKAAHRRVFEHRSWKLDRALETLRPEQIDEKVRIVRETSEKRRGTTNPIKRAFFLRKMLRHLQDLAYMRMFLEDAKEVKGFMAKNGRDPNDRESEEIRAKIIEKIRAEQDAYFKSGLAPDPESAVITHQLTQNASMIKQLLRELQ